MLNAHRARGAAALTAALLSLAIAVPARAAVQVSKLSIAISAIPTSVDAGEFNKLVIGRVNDQLLTPRGLEGIDNITFAWLFDVQLRYFVRPNFAVVGGFGQLRHVVEQEYLPALGAAIQYRAELLSVPVHVGGAYYLPPYTAGDFQARVYLEGGFTSLVYNRARFTAAESGTDSLTTLGGNYEYSARGDSPGYFLEGGVHMFFASRYSVLIGLIYRSSMVRDMQGEIQGINVPAPTIDNDLSGVGGRFGVAIGF